MNEDFESLIAGVRAGNTTLSQNAASAKIKADSKNPRLYGAGISLSEAMHFVATADTQTELRQDEAEYDAIAGWVNRYFEKKVAELHGETPVGHVGFLHPETGERVSFYG